VDTSYQRAERTNSARRVADLSRTNAFAGARSYRLVAPDEPRGFRPTCCDCSTRLSRPRALHPKCEI